MSDRFPIVALGASAGGVEAFREFFQNMPTERRLAIIVVLHLSRDRKSLLPEIIARWTAMPVISATNGMRVEPGQVYVVPGGVVARIAQDILELHHLSADQGQPTTAIDSFFDSLARDAGERAIGVVLSGTGHDGALGLKAIRKHGGMTIAQGSDGTAPQFAGMPDSAIATGAVDIVLPAHDIPGHIIAALPLLPQQPAAEQAAAGTEDEFRLEICRSLKEGLGHDFSQYKVNTFMRRVQRRMKVLAITELATYAKRVQDDRREAAFLLRDLLIGVTSFFRDGKTFEVLQDTVIPLLFQDKGPGDVLRVWVPGCATGEEAYSLAMLLWEHATTLAETPRLQIFATDIDEAAVAAARAGVYPATLVEALSPERLARFFIKTEKGYVVIRDIRDVCTFSPHSLIRDPPFSRVNFISCRNLLIYLDADAQGKVIPIFHYALARNGILLLGSSESVSRHAGLFAPLDKKHRIFQRRDVPSQLPNLASRSVKPARPDQNQEKPLLAGELSNQAITRARARILESYAAPYVVVTRAGEIVHFSNHTGKYLEPAVGAPSRNLLDLARPEIRAALRGVLRRAMETGRRVEQRVTGINEAAPAEALTLIAEPVAGIEPADMFLIVFARDQHLLAPEVGQSLGLGDYGISAALENENREVREQLQSISEEYETALEELRSSNEEMHSVNEEMQSSNEKLETSREEIQSINEELSTVNAQLLSKVDELDLANSDLRNLFESTRVATIFLDKHLVIRSFTPEVGVVYNLIPSDQGRPLTDIVSRLDYTDLRADVRQVLQTLEPLERRVQRLDGSAHFLMRILPYRTTDSAIDGLLVTFVDITGIVQAEGIVGAERHQRMLMDELNHRVKNMLSVVISLTAQTLRRAAGLEDFGKVFLGRLHALSATYTLLGQRNWSTVSLRDVLEEEMRPFMAEDRQNISLDGPEVALDSRGALAIGMAVHELCTNAVKYGALSVPEGNIAIIWKLKSQGGEEFFTLHWAERNGPPVHPPRGTGFGVTLIERGLTHDLNGEAKVEFNSQGVEARLRIPLHRIAPAAD